MQPAATPADMSDASYEADFVLWSERQGWLLREGRLDEIDVAHLAEEVEGVGNSYRDEIESRLTVLIAHLLSWKYQPGNRCKSSEATLTEQRRRIARVVRRTPSLRTCPRYVFADSHLSARLAAAKETGMDFTIFPTVHLGRGAGHRFSADRAGSRDPRLKRAHHEIRHQRTRP